MPKHGATRAPKALNQGRDVRQPFNRAPSPHWIRNYREQLNAKRLILRLQTFALDDPDNPTGPRLTRTQAQVALSLLRKVLPDMQAIEISGNPDQPIQVQILSFTGTELQEPPKPLITIDNEEAQVLGPAAARLVEDEPVSPRVTRRRKPNQ